MVPACATHNRPGQGLGVSSVSGVGVWRMYFAIGCQGPTRWIVTLTRGLTLQPSCVGASRAGCTRASLIQFANARSDAARRARLSSAAIKHITGLQVTYDYGRRCG